MPMSLAIHSIGEIQIHCILYGDSVEEEEEEDDDDDDDDNDDDDNDDDDIVG